MALKDSDLFVVQRVAGTAEEKGTYKMDAEQIQKYVEAGPSVNFWGTVDLTKAPLGGAAGDQLHDGVMPSNGDLYINDNGGQTGVLVVHPGWDTNNGGPAGENCIAGDRVVWDATPGLWRLIKDAGNVGGIVQSVEGGNGILVTGSQAEPVVNSDFGGDAAWGEAGTDAATKVASVAKVKEYVTAGTIEPGTYVLVSGDTMTGDLKFAEDRSTATPSIQIERSGGIIRKAKLRGQLQADVANNADPDYTLSKDDGLIVKSASTTGNGISVFAGGNTGGAVKATIANDGSASFASSKVNIDSSGKVGMGTSAPGELLDLADGSIRLNSGNGIYKANADGYLYLSGGTGITAGGTIIAFAESHNTNANEIQFRNSGNQTRVTIDSGGNVLMGKESENFATAGFQHRGDAIGLVQITRDGNVPLMLNRLTNDGTLLEFRKDTTIVGGISIQGSDLGIVVNGSERARIDSSGRLLVGTSNSSDARDITKILVSHGGAGADQNVGHVISCYASNDASSGFIDFNKSNSATQGTHALVGSDNLGQINFRGSDGAKFVAAASIKGESDGTAGTDDMPGRLVFSTTADGSSTPTERLRIKADGTSDFKGNLTLTAANGETNILLNPDGRAFFAGNNSRLRDTFPNATTYIEGGNPDDNEYGRIFMQHKDLPAFGWVKLSPDESFGGTSNDGVVITRGYARETLENVNKIMVFQGAFDLTEYVPYKSDIPNPNPRGIKSIEGAGAIEGVDGSGLRAPHPGDIVSHVPTGFFDDPENTPRQEDWYQHEANGKRFNAFAWRRPSAEDLEADENLTFGHVYTTTGAWVLAASIYDGSANPASHPLFRDPNSARPQTVSTGDMNGRGRNWYATLGQALDFNPLQLLQNLESVTSVGNDSTTGMFLCCDATLDEPNGTPIRDENDLLIPDRDTAKIKLNDNGTAEFAGNVDVGNWPTVGSRRTSSGAILVNRIDAETSEVWSGNFSGNETSRINANGSAEFAKHVNFDGTWGTSPIAGFIGNGAGFTYRNDSDNVSGFQLFKDGFNEPNITAKITMDGSAEFAGNVQVGDLYTDSTKQGSYISELGFVGARRDGTNVVFQGNQVGNSSPTFEVKADGSAKCTGDVEVTNNSANSGTTLYAVGGLRVEKPVGDPSLNFTTYYSEGTLKTRFGADGSAAFTGNVKVGDYDNDKGCILGKNGSIVIKHEYSGTTKVFQCFKHSTENVSIDATGSATFASNVQVGAFNTDANGSIQIFNNNASIDAFKVGNTTNGSNVKIKSDGSAEFASTVDINDRLRVYEATTSPGNTLFAVQSDLGGTRATQASILSNGSATFKGTLEAADYNFENLSTLP